MMAKSLFIELREGVVVLLSKCKMFFLFVCLPHAPLRQIYHSVFVLLLSDLYLILNQSGIIC